MDKLRLRFEKTGRAVFRQSAKEPFGLPSQLARLNLILDPALVKRVSPDPMVSSDLTGEQHPEGKVLPGPYNTLSE